MDANHLSKRLATVAQYVKKGARIADIGSDHAYLPVALAKTGQISYGIAGEVVRGPFENATHEIQREQVGSLIEARLADGLAAITPADAIDTIVIAGMGGGLIRQILDQGQSVLPGVTRLVLQPNVGEPGLRQWLVDHHYQIIAEDLLVEDGHDYEIIVAEPTTNPVQYSEKEMLFGPFLLTARPEAFEVKWRRELKRLEDVADSLSHAHTVPQAKIDNVNRQIELIKEVL